MTAYESEDFMFSVSLGTAEFKSDIFVQRGMFPHELLLTLVDRDIRESMSVITTRKNLRAFAEAVLLAIPKEVAK